MCLRVVYATVLECRHEILYRKLSYYIFLVINLDASQLNVVNLDLHTIVRRSGRVGTPPIDKEQASIKQTLSSSRTKSYSYQILY